MNRKLLLIFLFAIFKLSFAESYWQQFVHYQIKVKLNTKDHSLSGECKITYKNNSPDTLDRIYLHLYPNAFKNENSTLVKEAKKFLKPYRINSRNNGYIDILEFRISQNHSDVPPENAPISAYRVDDTILEAELPHKLLPGGQMQLFIRFYEKISSITRRGGYRGRQYDLTQWYPKPAVYDEKGWHPDQYHDQGEFYGEFGTFDVEITLPYNYIVAATGVPVKGDPGWEWVKVNTNLSDDEWEKAYQQQLEKIAEKALQSKERTVVFHAENVHDFAWLTSPDFLYERGEYHSIPIHVVYDKRVRKSWSKVVVRRAERVLKWLSEKFGLYPYPQLTVSHGLLGGGMEYPMIVMNSGPGEGLICHEVGHIYFYGILANNELEEAWLDEGFTSFQENWYEETFYGEKGYPRNERPRSKLESFLRPQTKRSEREILNLVDYTTSGYNEPLSKAAHLYKGGYRINAYTKGAMFYKMLKYVVGDSLWDRIAHEFFDRWKFKHVNEQRFKQVCEDVTGMDLDWFFDQWLHQTVNVDYALSGVKKKRLTDSRWQTEVKITRKDKGVMPVEVALLTESDTLIKRWDGKGKETVLTFETKEKPEKVLLDPKDIILDKNRLNNGNIKLRFIPDTPMSNFYQSRNEYIIRYKPLLWYNDIDGLWLGAGFKGHYQNRFRNVGVMLTYGLRSQKIGGEIRFRHPVLKNSEKLNFLLLARAREGRGIGRIGLDYKWSPMRDFPPIHRVNFSFNTLQLLKGGEEYTIEEINSSGNTRDFVDWQKGISNNFNLDYNFQWFTIGKSFSTNFKLEKSARILKDDFDYTKFQGEMIFRMGAFGRFLAVRLFGGRFWGDKIPLQSKFFLDGGNPVARYEKFYLRSRGSFPETLPYHFPGGGNMRGYIDQRISTEKIFSANVEASTLRWSPINKRNFRAFVNLTVFTDVANYENFAGKMVNVTDAGLGLLWRISSAVNFWTLRFNFPIYVSDPLPGEEHVKFRWLLSFQQAF